jgi:hypothetical protein
MEERMEAPTKLVGFALGMVAVSLGGAALGTAVGPVASDAETEHSGMHTDTAARAEVASELPGGLMVSQRGYTLALAQPTLLAGDEAPIRLRILGPDGTPVADYTESHGKDLHLVAIRRDMTGYQHVHPRLDTRGTWRVPLDLSEPGEYRVFADFTPAGHDQSLTLGADLSVAGTYSPRPLPAPSTTAQVDGYAVALDGALIPGEESELTLSVRKDGRPVTDLQPYLEAYGHLVALRDGDLAYLHVHPAGSPGDGSTAPGPEVTFYATAPSGGDYRLFLDFRHDGVVRTAEFTVAATGDSGKSGHDH